MGDEYERAAREVIEVREPAIDYLAEQLGKTRTATASQFGRWYEAVRVLHGSLVDFAEQLMAKFPEGDRPRLRVSELPALTEREWASIQKAPYWLFGLVGDSHGAHIDLSFSAIPPGGGIGGWNKEGAGVRLTLPSTDAVPLEHRIEALPTGHTFRVLRDGNASQAETEVSVLKLATELWTSAINHLLQAR